MRLKIAERGPTTESVSRKKHIFSRCCLRGYQRVSIPAQLKKDVEKVREKKEEKLQAITQLAEQLNYLKEKNRWWRYERACNIHLVLLCRFIVTFTLSFYIQTRKVLIWFVRSFTQIYLPYSWQLYNQIKTICLWFIFFQAAGRCDNEAFQLLTWQIYGEHFKYLLSDNYLDDPD